MIEVFNRPIFDVRFADLARFYMSNDTEVAIDAFDLGPWSRSITTPSSECQAWFDRGLNWTFAYNQEEAVRCYRKALEHDPDCAMAYWGIAYAAGPFYNRPWIRFSDKEIGETLSVCFGAAQSARDRSEGCTTAERGLIEAIGLRFQSTDEFDRDTLNRWHVEFTNKMRSIYETNPLDMDIISLFAEAAVTCTPRQLWNLKTGEPNPKALTVEGLKVLERGLEEMERQDIVHPGICHMYIHALEMSPVPEKALKAADMLRGFAPDAGHLEHMPAHIYVLCGDYAQAVEQSRRAVVADDKYVEMRGANNFYTTARCHDFHLYMYAAMFLGQYETAMYAAGRICTAATPELIQASPPFMAAILDGYSAMRTHVMVRFGRWHELVEDPSPSDPDKTPIRVSMHAYGQGIAHSALGNIKEAEEARDRFLQSLNNISADAIFLSNTVLDMLAVGEAMLEGELEYRKGNYDLAYDALRLAVERDDNLNYTEPWAWMHPPRHALGALLSEQGHFEEAEAVYRADLGYDEDLSRCSQHPDNVWALHGLVECVERTGRRSEASILRQKLVIAQARTDQKIKAACCCRSA